jgi:hypothetical protein
MAKRLDVTRQLIEFEAELTGKTLLLDVEGNGCFRDVADVAGYPFVLLFVNMYCTYQFGVKDIELVPEGILWHPGAFDVLLPKKSSALLLDKH